MSLNLSRHGSTEPVICHALAKKNGYEFNFEVTTIKVADALYICSPHSQVIALDAVTGAQLWRFDLKPETGNNAYLSCRGVAYHEAPAANQDNQCARRIIAPVADARLVALDADTGKPCSDFGDRGFVSLRQYQQAAWLLHGCCVVEAEYLIRFLGSPGNHTGVAERTRSVVAIAFSRGLS